MNDMCQRRQKVFVLGASRTGTTSLHKFFMDCGYKSIHYFVDEIEAIAKRKNIDKAGYTEFKEFVDSGDYNAFSDYPTRLYYRELMASYPDSNFVLSTRRNVEEWRSSMRRFFRSDPQKIMNLRHLTKLYISINADIRELYAGSTRFLEICIDEDNDLNSMKLRKFLGIDGPVMLKRLNYSKIVRK